MPYHNII